MTVQEMFIQGQYWAEAGTLASTGMAHSSNVGADVRYRILSSCRETVPCPTAASTLTAHPRLAGEAMRCLEKKEAAAKNQHFGNKVKG